MAGGTRRTDGFCLLDGCYTSLRRGFSPAEDLTVLLFLCSCDFCCGVVCCGALRRQVYIESIGEVRG